MKKFEDKQIGAVIRILRKEVSRLPDPSVTLVGKRWGDPFLVLISCILSLRTKDETTLPASLRLFELAQTPETMMQLSRRKIEKAIYPVGFYHVKTNNIFAICKSLIEDFKGEVPDTLEELLTLQGVGRKTANLVITEGFGKLGICVDTHVHRISNRLGYIKTKTPHDTEFALRKKLPQRYWLEYNCLLVLWGQNVCSPISPKCSQCEVEPYCCQVDVIKKR